MLFRLFDRIQTRPAAEDLGSPTTAATPVNPDRSASESWAEIGVKVGGDNEALRNLLVDVARRIDALDDLREIFGDAVTPIGRALDTLECETLDNVKLRDTLDQSNARHDTLRNEYE